MRGQLRADGLEDGVCCAAGGFAGSVAGVEGLEVVFDGAVAFIGDVGAEGGGEGVEGEAAGDEAGEIDSTADEAFEAGDGGLGGLGFEPVEELVEGEVVEFGEVAVGEFEAREVGEEGGVLGGGEAGAWRIGGTVIGEAEDGGWNGGGCGHGGLPGRWKWSLCKRDEGTGGARTGVVRGRALEGKGWWFVARNRALGRSPRVRSGIAHGGRRGCHGARTKVVVGDTN
jgi:hypothetical protein